MLRMCILPAAAWALCLWRLAWQAQIWELFRLAELSPEYARSLTLAIINISASAHSWPAMRRV